MLFRKLLIFTVIQLFVVLSFNSQTVPVVPDLLKKADKTAMNHWVDSVFNSMSMDEKIGQTIMVITTGENTAANKKKLVDFVKNQYVGGIIFLKGTPHEQAALTNACQAEARTPLMITIDGEWGLSMRLENTTRFPKNMMVGAIQDDSLIYLYGREVARQCRIMGIHADFAPDMDVNSNPENPVIGIRSYGEDPARVSHLGILFSKGLESGGVLSVSKHFPGHGDTSTDSHHVLPLIEHRRERLDSIELYPFREYINAGLSGMMIAHLNIPVLDKSGLPSSLSKPVITDLLIDELGFTGLIFTDGLPMKGVADQPDMSIKALSAGIDILLGPVSPIKEFNAIKKALEDGAITDSIIEERCRKILTYKYLLNVHKTERIQIDGLYDRLNTSYAEWIARRMNQKAITLLRNEDAIIPLKNLDKRKIAAVSIGGTANNVFHQTLKLYDDVVCFNVADASALSGLKSTLEAYNTVIISIHANKSYNAEAISNIIKEKNSLLVFFTVPYRLSSYKSAIDKSDAVIVGYENTELAQEYAAQALFGGNSIEGRLPVTVKSLYKIGDGIKTEKTRLSYNMPEEVGIPAYRLNRIAEIVKEGIKEEAFPGCQVLIAKNGVVIYNHSFGNFEYNKQKAVTNDDIYDIASMTKATATVPAVMKLYDDKKITLRSQLSDYVPALKNTDKASITVRDALFHETGIRSFIAYYMPAINKNSYSGRLFSNARSEEYNALLDENTWARTDYKFFPTLISSVPKEGYTLHVADNMYANKIYRDTIIQNIADSKLRANKDYHYSCLNFMLLKEAVENIAKKDLNTYLQDNIYKKLGATTTTYNPLKKFKKERIVPTEKDDFLRKQLIQGYVHDEGAALLGGISGNAGIFSNTNDLAKLYQMYLNLGNYGGEQIISKETCRMFTTTKSAKSRRGLGFDKPDLRNNKSSPCSPQTPASTYGHTGFTGTCFWIDPDNNLIYVFLSNRVYDKRTHKNINALSIRSRIQEEIYNSFKRNN